MNQDQVRLIIAAVCYAITNNSINATVLTSNSSHSECFIGNYSGGSFRLSAGSFSNLTINISGEDLEKTAVITGGSYGQIGQVWFADHDIQKVQDLKNSETYSQVRVAGSEVRLDSHTIKIQ